MPLIDLARVIINESAPDSNYYVGAVVNSSSGPKEIKVITDLTGLETYFPDLKFKEGYKKILNSGAFLALKRLENDKTRVATLRLTSNPHLRYVYPRIYDNIDLIPADEDTFASGIIVDALNDGLPLGGEYLSDGGKINVPGIVHGNWNEGDTITCFANNASYTAALSSEGTFEFNIDKINLLLDEYSRLTFSLFTLNNGLFVEIKGILEYSIVGLPDLRIKLKLFNNTNVIDTNYLTPSQLTYTVEGLVSGDYSTGDPVTLYIDSIPFFTTCSSNGSFSYDIPIDIILDNNFIEVKVIHMFNGSEFKAISEMSYISDFLVLDLESNEVHKTAYIDIQSTGTKTLNYEIDFNTSQMLDEDYIIIPRADFPSWNNNLMIYYVTDSTKTPDDFVDPVSLQSVSTPQYRLTIPQDEVARSLMRNNRAKYIYDLFTGSINGINTGVIKKLCKLDEINNRVTLVFDTPISDISYFSSGDTLSPFKVSCNEDLNSELLTTYSRNESIISFSTLLEGDLEVKLKLVHDVDYKYFLTETLKETRNTYYISLEESDRDYNNQIIFAEDVINGSSILIKCKVHNLPDNPKDLEGDYLVSKGIKGNNINSDLSTYESSLEALFSSDVKLNAFLSDEFRSKEYLEVLQPKLDKHQVVGFTEIPDEALNYVDLIDFKSNLDQFLLPIEKREYLIYSFGKVEHSVNEYIPSYFYLVREAIGGDFIADLTDNVMLSYLKPEEIVILESNWVNYLEETNSNYNVIEINNHPKYLEPIYLMISIYVKQILTRFLQGKLGEFPMNIFFSLNILLASLRRYSELISSLEIENFDVKTNTLRVRFELELTGLMGKLLSIEINLNTNK